MNFFLRKISESARAHAPAKPGAEMPAGVEAVLDLPYFGTDGVALFGDLYRPAGRANALPVAVMVHGGGLFSGGKEGNRAFCAAL